MLIKSLVSYFSILFVLILLFLPKQLVAQKKSNFCQQNKTEKTLFCLDFHNHKKGMYTSDILKTDWPNLQSLSTKLPIFNWGVSQDRVKLIEFNNNLMLEIFYPKDSSMENWCNVENAFTWFKIKRVL